MQYFLWKYNLTYLKQFEFVKLLLKSVFEAARFLGEFKKVNSHSYGAGSLEAAGELCPYGSRFMTESGSWLLWRVGVV